MRVFHQNALLAPILPRVMEEGESKKAALILMKNSHFDRTTIGYWPLRFSSMLYMHVTHFIAKANIIIRNLSCSFNIYYLLSLYLQCIGTTYGYVGHYGFLWGMFLWAWLIQTMLLVITTSMVFQNM